MTGISVLIVTYNRAHLISETIRSVLAQTFTDFELIIVDDGSTDNTAEIISNFNDSRLQYFRLGRLGNLAALRNLAIRKSTRPFISFIDSDDIWQSEKLEKSLNACRIAGTDMCITDTIEFSNGVFNEKSNGYRINHLRNPDLKLEIVVNNVPLCTNMFFHRRVYDALQGFNENLRIGDHDFICRALAHTKVCYIPECLSFIRRHDTNMTHNTTKIDLTPFQEYNFTLDNLYQKGLLSKKEFRLATARNFYAMAIHSIHNGEQKPAWSYLWRALIHQRNIRKLVRFLKKKFATSQ